MRATGKTYRLCLQACLFASQGQRVYFVCEIKNHLEQAYRMCHTITQDIPIKHIARKWKIIFPGEGSIEFIPNLRPEYTLGIKNIKVINDY